MENQSVAVICEVNPLHCGHKFLFNEARKRAGDGPVIAIMSGNFVQRGTPAIFDKQTRTETLLASGVDLVLELPFPWCASKAGSFAKAGVSIASKIHADLLLFGSESGDQTKIERIADAYQSKDFLEAFYKQTSNIGEMKAMENALNLSPDMEDLGANDRLAAGYVQECRKRSLNYEAVRRFTDSDYHSASEIREAVERIGFEKAKSFFDDSIFQILKKAADEGSGPVTTAKYLDLFYTLLSFCFPPEIETAEGNGGVKERILSCAQRASNSNEFFASVQTKRYTASRLRRAMLFMVCGVPEPILLQEPAYSFVLGFTEKGSRYLGSIRKTTDLLLLTKPSHCKKAKETAAEQLEYYLRSEAIYSKLLPITRSNQAFLKNEPIHQ